MPRIIESLATINSMIRTGLAVLAVGLIATAGYYGYRTYNASALEMKEVMRAKEKELASLVSRQKERLDSFLMQTLRIERELAETTDVNRLQNYLEEVTGIKLQALQELTEEDLRGNQEFSIFLDQCSHLIGRIQHRVLSQEASGLA